ncbi:hypothetical protein [Mucilaginibacter ginkgonis]|uniref:Uncharacterized protein n=1 Tax=Mucilaginibacter ginkgonis TaxID=2682091 RepID=A0A6I4HVZ2_9SPHI|nr:hypothetical protein [Mucilaginibacter ginkgonis]QQL51096.1 hypothetical protein GO620_006500 [Mucilaginibacter ginkgonis]
MLTKTDLDARLKADAAENRFKIEADNLVFDKNSNLTYQVVDGFTLADLLTANPLSITKLNKNLLVALANIKESFEGVIKVIASYRSPEYNLLSYGGDSDLYTSGCALSLAVDANLIDKLVETIKEVSPMGELFIYKWGVHIGYAKGENKETDYRTDVSWQRKIKDFISNDRMKNVLLIGAAAVAGWFFFLRKK